MADDDEYTIIYIKPKAITPDLPAEEPDNSLSMGDEHLNTIPKMEKSSAENLVPILSESKGISDDIYDVPSYDNDHFDAEFRLINSLLNRDISITSPKIDFLPRSELAHIDPIPQGIEEPTLIYRKKFVLLRICRMIIHLHDRRKNVILKMLIRLSSLPLHLKTPLRIVTLIWRRSIYFLLPMTRCLRELLSNDPFPLPKIKSSNLDHFNDPSSPRPPPEPPDVEICFNVEPDKTVKNDFDELNEDECFDPVGGEIDVFENVEDDDYFSFTFIIRIFLPYLTYPEVSPLLLSTGSEDTIFDPIIST
ncbi:hypothetical protein Tco_0374137 [Tanacetum coccineum]